ncbi:MAG: amidohydrolase [Saprospiraceae bacterium]|nr:amidohydrolase [Saprospiraceae bacterium]
MCQVKQEVDNLIKQDPAKSAAFSVLKYLVYRAFINRSIIVGSLIRILFCKPICLLFTVALFFISCDTSVRPVDLILYNGKIISVDQDHTISEALAIKNGKFLSVGSNQEIKKLFRATQSIDLQGLSVIPGIIEGHVHPIPASISEHFEEIPDVKTIAELLSWVQLQVQEKPQGSWIIHPKFFATRLQEMRQPTIVELDSVAPDHPVFLDGSYGGMVNSAALRMSNVSTRTAEEGFLRDPQSGELNGMLRRSAFEFLAIDHSDQLSDEERRFDLTQLLQMYNQVGITSITAGSGTTKDLDVFKSLRTSGDLTVRIFQNISIPFNHQDSIEQMRQALDDLGYHTGTGDEWVRVGALKAVIDGGVLTGTAYLREPWGLGAKEIYGITDPTYRGVLRIGQEDLERMILVALEKDWKFTAHVTGGGGVDVLLNAIESVAETQNVMDKRFSVIHGNFYTENAIIKMKNLGVYADMQPAWFFKDADLLYQVLGEDRMQTFHPYKSLFDAGAIVNGGSDHMVKLNSYTAINPYNPFLSMWSVVTRKTELGSVYNTDQALSRLQALQMYTINNAFASFEEDIKGSIEPGKLADLAVISEDLLTCAEDRIKEIQVVLTMVDGNIVFDNGTLDVDEPEDRER